MARSNLGRATLFLQQLPKLEGQENYPDWAKDVAGGLRIANVWEGVVEEDQPLRPENTRIVRERDVIAKTLIIGTLGRGAVSVLLPWWPWAGSARELWEKLKRRFHTSKRTKKRKNHRERKCKVPGIGREQ